jgi:lysozyme
MTSPNDDLHVTDEGRRLIEEREGNILHAYQDTVGVWTIGYGHTHFDGAPVPVRGMTITQQQADDMLTRDIVRYENIVKKNVVAALADHEFDALTSICYNVEVALGPRSSIVRCLNKGDREGAARAILLYDKPPEIRGRREGEYKQFLTPYS